MIRVEDGMGDMLTELEDDEVETLVAMDEVTDGVGDIVIDSDTDNDDKEVVGGVVGVVEVDGEGTKRW